METVVRLMSIISASGLFLERTKEMKSGPY